MFTSDEVSFGTLGRAESEGYTGDPEHAYGEFMQKDFWSASITFILHNFF